MPLDDPEFIAITEGQRVSRIVLFCGENRSGGVSLGEADPDLPYTGSRVHLKPDASSLSRHCAGYALLMQAFVAPRLPTGIRHIEVFPSVHEVVLRDEDGCRGLSSRM